MYQVSVFHCVDLLHKNHHGRGKAEDEPHAANDAAIGNDVSWNGRGLGLQDLNGNESYEKDAEEHEQSDDTAVTPWVSATAPLQSEK